MRDNILQFIDNVFHVRINIAKCKQISILFRRRISIWPRNLQDALYASSLGILLLIVNLKIIIILIEIKILLRKIIIIPIIAITPIGRAKTRNRMLYRIIINQLIFL